MMIDLELLSPAGDLEIFKAVIDAGADAVYFGGDLFGARAYAKNFTFEEAEDAIRYAHIHGAKAYLTVNTLLKNLEIENKLYDYLKTYVEMGIDAFIVQDIGVFSLIRESFPETHVHVSTQMSISSPYGAKFVQDMGATRIVTARELSINEIASIHRELPELEIESFIHGALCVCYSGQCLMSSIIGGRSGNRGRCAQPCRLPYRLLDKDGNTIKTRGNYILSPKDFCTIEHLPDMIDAGVISFKIEGRMKQLNYAAGVVSVYRKYLDKYLEYGKDGYVVEPTDLQKLLDYGNRSGFTDLYLNKHNGPDMITFEEPSHKKNDIDFIKPLEQKIKVDCNVSAKANDNLVMSFETVEKRESVSGSGNIIELATGNPTSIEDIKKHVIKCGNTPFEIRNINIDADTNIFIPVSAIKNLRRNLLENLENALLQRDNKCIFAKTEVPMSLQYIESNAEGLIVKVVNESQLNALIKYDKYISKISSPISLCEKAKSAFPNKEIIGVLPTVIRNDYVKNISFKVCDYFMACSMDGLGLLDANHIPHDKVYLDNRIYTMSNRTNYKLMSMGYKMDCIPYELSIKELANRNNVNSSMVIYSRIPLMVMANCSIKNTIGCNKENMTYRIKDRTGSEFLCQCDCENCYNTIYNCKLYCAFSEADKIKNLSIMSYRIDFNFETADEVENIMDLYIDAFVKGIKINNPNDTTKGHLNRGVE